MNTEIDFSSLELLNKAKSKKFVKKLFEESFRLRKIFKSYKKSNESPLLASVSDTLEIKEDQA